MNHFTSDSSTITKKKAARSKYNKLTKEQKLEIIKEWDRSRLSGAAITNKFSSLWGIKLSARGIADIITYWKENGKVRGYSQDDPVYVNVYNEIIHLCHFCQYNSYQLDKQQFKSFIQYIQTRDHLQIESYEMVWLDTVCEHCSNELASISQSLSSNTLSSFFSLFSQFPPSSIFCLDFCSFQINSSPITFWTLLNYSTQSNDLIWDVSLSSPSSMTLLSIIEKLDKSMSEKCLILFCDCYQFIKEITEINDVQVITFHTTGNQTLTITVHSLHLLLIPRLLASSLLPTYRGISVLLRIALKHYLLLHQFSQLEDCQQEINKMLHSVNDKAFWGLGSSSSVVLHSIDDVKSCVIPEVKTVYSEFHNTFEQYQQQWNEIGDEKHFFEVDEDIRHSGFNAVLLIIHQLDDHIQLTHFVNEEISASHSLLDVNAVQQQLPSDQILFFRNLYGDLIANLPDVTHEDFMKMDLFFNRINENHVL